MEKIINEKIIIGVILLLLLLLAGFFISTALPQKRIPMTVDTRHIMLGAWTEGLFDAPSQTLHPEKLQQFELLVQKHMSIAHYYRGWESLADPNVITQFNTLRSHGWEPMLNANPYYFSECPASDIPLYRAIADGACDAFLHKAGKNLSIITQPFFLLFAWEMNNPSNEWSVIHTGSTAQDFVDAWRHIHTIFQQEKVTNVKWVFDPNVPDDAQVSYQSLYPGDAYVDWIGLDGYNWGTTQSWSQWDSFSGIFTGSYNTLTAIAPHKPVIIAEVNTTDEGGDKAAWYTDMLTQQLPYHFPKVAAVVIFNEDRTAQEHVNWNIDVTPESLQAFIQGIHTPFY